MLQRLLYEKNAASERGLAKTKSARKRVEEPTGEEPPISFRRAKSFQIHASLGQVIQELEENGNLENLEQRVEIALQKDFPLVERLPTAENMEDSMYRHPTNPKLKFEQGQWCEYLGLDMKWHLRQVKRVVRVAPEKWLPQVDRKPNWSYAYSFRGGDLVPKQKVRAPEEALKREFGLRPWLWQQWAFLKVENMTRFQRFHERDFETLNFGLTANLLFIQWLDDERNADFKQFFEGKEQAQRDKLVDHLLAPFVLCDDISKDPRGDQWDFAHSKDISLYMYVSLLGAGWLACLGALIVQWSIPTLLFYEAVAQSNRFNLANYSDNSWDRFCVPNTEASDFDTGLAVNILILVFYLMRNLPMVLKAYVDTEGEMDTVNSKVESLRSLVQYSELENTSFGMRLGFRIERFMNSAFLAMVNTSMLATLALHNNMSFYDLNAHGVDQGGSPAMELIMDAIAIEFVYRFDTDVVGVRWLDPFFRYIRAATTELVFRANINTLVLSDSDRLCTEYDIAPQTFAEAVAGDGFPTSSGLNCAALARLDRNNPQYMRAKDRVWQLGSQVAKRSKHKIAQNLFVERIAKFDLVSRAFVWLSPFGIFNRWPALRTWSRWDKLLFASPCGVEYVPPNLASSSPVPSVPGEPRQRYLNESEPSSDNVYVRFIEDSVRIILLIKMWRELARAWRLGSPVRVLGAFADGLVEWIAIIYLLLFPFTFPMFFIWLVSCY